MLDPTNRGFGNPRPRPHDAPGVVNAEPTKTGKVFIQARHVEGHTVGSKPIERNQRTGLHEGLYQYRGPQAPAPSWAVKAYREFERKGLTLYSAIPARLREPKTMAVLATLRPDENRKPRGYKLSSRIRVKVTVNVTAARETIRTVDSLFPRGLPLKSRIPLRDLTDAEAATATALFEYARDGRVLALGIAKDTFTPRLSLAHEIGHWIEFEGIPGGGIGTGIVRDFAADPRFADWIKTVESSETFQRLRQRHEELRQTKPLSNRQRRDLRTAHYYLQWGEVWSRVFQQWVATKSQNRKLLNELNQRRLDTGINRRRLWNDTEFLPILEATDSLFRSLGWL